MLREFAGKLAIIILLAGLSLGTLEGCGQRVSAPPPLTEEVKAQIQKEDQAVFEAESAQARGVQNSR